MNIKESAEYVLKYANGVLEDDATDLLDAAVVLAKAAMSDAVHPFADPAPITPAVLEAIEFTNRPGSITWERTVGTYNVGISWFGHSPFVTARGVPQYAITTVGDLNNLLHRLGRMKP